MWFYGGLVHPCAFRQLSDHVVEGDVSLVGPRCRDPLSSRSIKEGERTHEQNQGPRAGQKERRVESQETQGCCRRRRTIVTAGAFRSRHRIGQEPGRQGRWRQCRRGAARRGTVALISANSGLMLVAQARARVRTGGKLSVTVVPSSTRLSIRKVPSWHAINKSLTCKPSPVPSYLRTVPLST